MVLKGLGAKMNWLAVDRQSWSNSDSVFKGLNDVSTICGYSGPVQLEAFILILGMEMQNRKMLKRATVGVINDRLDKYMNGSEVNQWEGRINERNLGFRMQTAVRGEAVTRPLIACLCRAFESSSFFDRVWGSLYGLLGALSDGPRASRLLPVPKTSGSSNFLVAMLNSFYHVRTNKINTTYKRVHTITIFITWYHLTLFLSYSRDNSLRGEYSGFIWGFRWWLKEMCPANSR
jgi:hypothetical protein